MPVARRLTDKSGAEFVEVDGRGLLTMEEVEQMSPDDISRDWQRVSECLEAGRRQSDIDAAMEADDDEDETPAGPQQSGMTIPNEARGGEEHQPLSMDFLRKQSVDWHREHKETVDAFLQRSAR